MMDEQRHADGPFIHLMTEAFDKCVVIIETGVNLLNRPKYPSFILFGRVAKARTFFVGIQIVRQASAEAVIQSSAGKLFGVLHIRGTPETNVLARIEHSEDLDDRLLLRVSETSRAGD